MPQQPAHAIVVEFPQRLAIGGIFERDLGGDGIFQRFLDHAGASRPSTTVRALPGRSGFPEMRDDAGPRDQPRRLDAHQFRIARTEADAIDGRGGAHSTSLATALRAAAAIALPPRRPRTMTLGTRARAKQGLLGFRRPDKADGNADHGGGRYHIGLLQDFEQAKQGGRRVADHHHRTRQSIPPQLHGGRGAGGAACGGKLRHARIGQRADHGVVGRQPCPR